MVKCCNTCNQTKPLSDFRKDASTTSGYRYDCKICARAYHSTKYSTKYSPQVKRRGIVYRAKNGVIIDEYKIYCGCIKCDERRHPVVLDLHHIDPNGKDFSIGEARGKAASLIINEIQKCVVLCCICHRLLHVGAWELSIANISDSQLKYSKHFAPD